MHTMLEFEPAAAETTSSPIGSTIAVDCVSGDPSVTMTQYTIVLDSPPSYIIIQDADNFPSTAGLYEQIMLTCTPTGQWEVTAMVADPNTPSSFNPISGIVSRPTAIACLSNTP